MVLPRRKNASQKLLRMKLFTRFYVFTYEARAKLYVAKKDHDHKFHKATSDARRPSESYTGADRGTPPAPRFRRAVASGSSAPGLFRVGWGRQRFLRIQIPHRHESLACGRVGSGARSRGRNRCVLLFFSSLIAFLRTIPRRALFFVLVQFQRCRIDAIS